MAQRLLVVITLSTVMLALGYPVSGEDTKMLLKRDGHIHSLSVSRDERTLVCGLSDGALVFHDLEQKSDRAQRREFLRLIDQLDADRFAQRHAAFEKLVSAGRYARPILEPAHQSAKSPEVRLRIARLLEGLHPSTAEAHLASVRQVVFSPTEQLVASVGRRGAVKLWNAARGRVTCELPPLAHGAWSVDFSCDGRMLAVGGGDGTIRVWNLEELKLLTELQPLKNVVHAVAFTPDGRLLAAGGFDKSIHLLDLTSPSSHRQLAGHEDGILDIDIDSDGGRFASVGYDGGLRVWSLETCEEVAAVRHPPDKRVAAARSVAFDATGELVAVGSDDGAVTVWAAAELVPLKSSVLHQGTVRSVLFSNDSRQIYSVGDDGRALCSAVNGD